MKRGDVLAEIDPRTYQAQLDQAVAKKAQDEATLANARLDLERYTRLAATNSGSKQQADTQRALVAQLEAQVQGDQAAIDNARTMLELHQDHRADRRPHRHAPGRRRQLRAGGRRHRHRGDHADPADLGAVHPAAAAISRRSARPSRKARLPVDAVAADGKTVIDRGKLQVIDNQVDQTTGTIRLKAEFPNARAAALARAVRQRARAGRDAEAGVVVPTAAVQRGPNGTFVYVVDAESKVAVRPVKVAQQDDTSAVISEGLKAGRARGDHRLHAAVRRHARAGAGGRTAEPEPRRADTPQAPDAGAGRTPAQARRRRRARRTPTARSAAAPRTRRARRARSNERLGALHRAADRDLAARRRGAVRRAARLSGGCRSRRCRRSTSRPSR